MGDENEKYFIPCCMKFQYAVEESLPRNVISVQNLLSFEKIEIILHEDVSDSCIYLTPSHTTHNKTAKNAVIFHTHYNFFSQLLRLFSTVFYMSNDFLTDFFRKIFAVSCIVYKGLYVPATITRACL